MYKISIQLPDGSVMDFANNVRVLIEDDKPGTRMRVLESLVRDADEWLEGEKFVARMRRASRAG